MEQPSPARPKIMRAILWPLESGRTLPMIGATLFGVQLIKPLVSVTASPALDKGSMHARTIIYSLHDPSLAERVVASLPSLTIFVFTIVVAWFLRRVERTGFSPASRKASAVLAVIGAAALVMGLGFQLLGLTFLIRQVGEAVPVLDSSGGMLTFVLMLSLGTTMVRVLANRGEIAQRQADERAEQLEGVI